MSKRESEFSRSVKVAAVERSKKAHGGDLRCEKCTAKMTKVACFDHIKPVAEGGPSTLENCQCLCATCTKIKNVEDNKRIKKGNKKRDKNSGALARGRTGLEGRSPERKEEDRAARVKPGRLPMPTRKKDAFGRPWTGG